MSKNKTSSQKNILLLSSAALSLALIALSPNGANAQSAKLNISPYPNEMRKAVYNTPVKTRDIRPEEVSGRSYLTPSQTLIGGKISELLGQLTNLQKSVTDISGKVYGIERASETTAAKYYATIATISTQLQSGTTRGNPRLVEKVTIAEENLSELAGNVAELNSLARRIAHVESEAAYLLDTIRAAYGLSGALEEDHVKLAQLEDAITNTIVLVERVLNNVEDNITRATAYLSSERNNMRTLALAVTNGDLYGKSLSNRPFSAGIQQFNPAPMAANETGSGLNLPGARPLVKILFDRPHVEFEQPVYMAVNEALDRFPNASFELVAVNPLIDNAAKAAIESTRARRNAERVLRTLTQMGLPLERVELSFSDSQEARSSEVHIYIR